MPEFTFNTMKQFQYKAHDKEGKTIKGVVEAMTEQVAARTLQEKGLMVLDLSEKSSFSFGNLSLNLSNVTSSVSEREIAIFTRLLSTMLSTGLPLTDTMGNLVLQTNNAYFKDILRSIAHDIQSGVSMSESMARYPKVFSDLYVNLIKVGEASGKVDDVLSRLADSLESSLEFKARVQGAMIYPLIVSTAMLGIGIFMLVAIIPKIADVYHEFGAELPLPTRILVGLSNFVTNYTIFALIGVALLIYAYKTIRNNQTGDYLLNNLVFKLPIFGELNMEIILTVTTKTLAILLSSGVAIIDALEITAKTLGNNIFRSGFHKAISFVEKGVPLSLAFRRNPDFPAMMGQLMAIGEETGTLDKSLERISKFYGDSAERKVKNLTTMLEPVLILFMGAMIGLLAIAVLLPMFNLVNVIK